MHQEFPDAEVQFYALMARKLAGTLSEAEGAALEALFLQVPAWRLQLELLEAMFSQERSLPPSDHAREAFVRHWLKYQHELTAFPDLPSSMPLAQETKAGPETSSMPPDAWAGSSHNALRRGFRLLRLSVPVLGILLMGMLTLWLWPGEKDGTPAVPVAASMEMVEVGYGGKQKLTLPDGSTVWLNAGSRLQYDKQSFNASRREVFLSGEAYFDITHRNDEPFLVRSGQVQIRVLGTAFNVRAYPGDEDIETSLIRGSVEVTLQDRPDDVYILRPNEKLVVSNGNTGTVQRETVNKGPQTGAAAMVSLHHVTVADSGTLIQETAWLEDKMVFRSEPFASLAVRMERRYGVRIQFRRPEMTALRFTGIFTTETIGQALDAMRLVHPFEYVVDKENIYIQ